MNRILNLIIVSLLILLLIFPIVAISIAVSLTSKGPILHWSKRAGLDSKLFLMPKFRTMKESTPQVATHLLEDPEMYYTELGKFLRKTSMDELPQIFSILRGDMSFVGPRPALYNQDDLIRLRNEKGINSLTPGITGWAQVNGRDEITILDKVRLDYEYLQKRSLTFDLYIIWLTVLRVIKSEGVSH